MLKVFDQPLNMAKYISHTHFTHITNILFKEQLSKYLHIHTISIASRRSVSISAFLKAHSVFHPFDKNTNMHSSQNKTQNYIAKLFTNSPHHSIIERHIHCTGTMHTKKSQMDLEPILDSECSSDDEVMKVLEFLQSQGCSKKDIKDKCLQHVTNAGPGSYMKAVLISELGDDIPALMPMMALSLPALKLVVKQAREDKFEIEGFPNRIAYLSHHLETNVSSLIPALAKHSALLTMKFFRLEEKMNILKSASIDSEHIVKDLWIFNYNEKLLASRVNAAEKAGVDLKPWMLRCSEKIFDSVLVKYSEANSILKGEDELMFLAKRLECSTDYIEYMMERNKLMATINIPKLDKIITFLYEKGYKAEEIRLFPRIFCSSVHTLSKRFDQYKEIRSTIPTLSQLITSIKKFEKSPEKHS